MSNYIEVKVIFLYCKHMKKLLNKILVNKFMMGV